MHIHGHKLKRHIRMVCRIENTRLAQDVDHFGLILFLPKRCQLMLQEHCGAALRWKGLVAEHVFMAKGLDV